MKRFIFLAAFLLSSILLLGGSLFLGNKQTKTPAREEEKEKEVILLLVGDIMLDRGVEFYIKQNGGDWRFPFLNIADFLRKADLVFGNLESVISDKGENLGSVYSFRADPKALEGLAFAGLDVLSVANNHSMDYGMEAFLDSLQRLKKTGIAYVGGGTNTENAHSPVIQEVEGTKIGFLGYTNLGSPLWQATDKTPGIAWVDENTVSEFQENIAAAKEQLDILIVSLHFGEEYQTQPNALQEFIAKSAIEAGADIVVGHHPHVVQPVVQYQQGWIAYSLGNFVFDQGFSTETMKGLLLEVTIQDKKIKEVLPLPIRMNNSFQPELAN